VKTLGKNKETMKRLLMICAVILLVSCASTKDDEIYKQQLREGSLTKKDYKFNIRGNKDLLMMRRMVDRK